MKLVYDGKTKKVYDLENGNFLFEFKDDGTVDEAGNFDPGGNRAGIVVKGMGSANLRLSDFFFKKINEAGIASHYVSADLEKSTMTVKPAEFFGNGLEFICRFKATGSFMRRYASYAKEGQDLPALVEITVKDDEHGDPPITRECLEALGLINEGEYSELVSMTQKIAVLIKNELAKKDALLYDIKFEFGRRDGKIILIDEISGGSMRVYKEGTILHPFDIAGLILS